MARNLTPLDPNPRGSTTSSLQDPNSEINSINPEHTNNPFGSEAHSLDSSDAYGNINTMGAHLDNSYIHLLPSTGNGHPTPSRSNYDGRNPIAGNANSMSSNSLTYSLDQDESSLTNYLNPTSSFLAVSSPYPARGPSSIFTNEVNLNSNRNSFNSSNSNLDPTNSSFVDADFSPFGGYPASSFPLHMDEKEDDDYLHNPDPILDAQLEGRCCGSLKELDRRGWVNAASFMILILGAIVLFVVYPVITYTGVTNDHGSTSYEVLTEYTYPLLSGIRTNLIDSDTPKDAYTREARSGDDWKLVFSDEFNTEGRTFYEGDDQFWVAPDIWYSGTVDLEWYDPDASTTANGSLQLRLDAYKNHNMFYRSGMLQSWNKLCFTQGIMEVSAQLPNYGNVTGLWPGIWSMGNLGRPGYKASTEGVWPYSYEACDAGATANQSSADGISYLPGQRLNSCVCSGEDHPNIGTGRGSPEIDALEGAVDTTLPVGTASQSLQTAPYNIWYIPDYDFVEIHNKTTTAMNTYAGGPFQQAVSAVTTLNNSWYENYDYGENYFQKYSIEYLNDKDDGYIKWFVGDDPTMTLHSMALHPDGNIDWRLISKEPMAMVLNLGISNSWAYINWLGIVFPSIMKIDYVRIYQPSDQVSMTCDPSDYPTYEYINDHPKAYKNPNYTTWDEAGYAWPKNSLIHGC